MSAILVEVTRGSIVESRHHGHVAVCDGSGRLRASAGDPGLVTYWRSAAKPFQALNVVLTGAADAFALADPELALTCSSHYGEPFHRAAVLSILAKCGLGEEHLRCGPSLSLKAEFAQRMTWDNIPPHPLYNDCSGKHAGMLAVCRHLGFELATYLAPDHPMQRQILAIIARVADWPSERIAVGIDGCSAPVHALPLRNMACAYARLATPDSLPPDHRSAAGRIFRVMTAHPEMIAGTGGFCTGLMRATKGRLVGKIGAEGIYCVGVRGRDLGLAVKIDGGNMRVLAPAVIRLLETLGQLSPEESAALDDFRVIPNLNDVGTRVGEIRAAGFELKAG